MGGVVANFVPETRAQEACIKHAMPTLEATAQRVYERLRKRTQRRPYKFRSREDYNRALTDFKRELLAELEGSE